MHHRDFAEGAQQRFGGRSRIFPARVSKNRLGVDVADFAGTLLMVEQSKEFSIRRELAAEVLARCDEVASYSEEPDKITRTFLSEPMRRLHERLTQWMEEAGLSVRLDAAGNLIGRYEGLRPELPVLAIGSHLDTVPNAGKYDGVLGVLLGVAAVQALGGRRLPFGIDVIGFSEEEGMRYRASVSGQPGGLRASFDRRLLDRTDATASPWPRRFASSGSIRTRIGEAAYPPGDMLGYLELHIEQGPVLESLGAPVGVVTSIAGQSRIWAELGAGRVTPAQCPWKAGAMRWRLPASSCSRSSGWPIATPGLRRPSARSPSTRARPTWCRAGAVEHRRSPRARSGPGRRRCAELVAQRRRLAQRRGVEFRVTAAREPRRRSGRSGR